MIKTIVVAISAYTGTFKLIHQLKLWRYFTVPILLSIFIALGIAFTAWGLSDNLGDLISRLWIWEWGFQTFRKFGNFIAAMIILVLGLILYRHLVMALSAPFMSPISEKIERHYYGSGIVHRKTAVSAQLWRGIRLNLRNLSMELLLTIPVLLIGFIPVVGVVSAVLIFLIQSYYAGFGNMDYTLERYLSYSESIRLVRQNKGIAIGNGIIFMLLLLIPVVGIIIVMPFSVTAASTETLKLLDHVGILRTKEPVNRIFQKP